VAGIGPTAKGNESARSTGFPALIARIVGALPGLESLDDRVVSATGEAALALVEGVTDLSR